MIKIIIPFKTPTINSMYATFRGHRVKSKEARILSKEVEKIVKSQENEIILGELELELKIFSNWYNQNKTIKKRDIANLEKFITDSVFNHLKMMDDKQIFKIKMEKIQSNKEKVMMVLKKYKGGLKNGK